MVKVIAVLAILLVSTIMGIIWKRLNDGGNNRTAVTCVMIVCILIFGRFFSQIINQEEHYHIVTVEAYYIDGGCDTVSAPILKGDEPYIRRSYGFPCLVIGDNIYEGCCRFKILQQ